MSLEIYSYIFDIIYSLSGKTYKARSKHDYSKIIFKKFIYIYILI